MNEMDRVIKPGGYLFLTFPAMNFFRKYKVARNQYQIFDEKQVNLEQFYQFAFDPVQVKQTFEKCGFRVVTQHGQGCFIGLSKETRTMKKIARVVSQWPFGIWTKLNMLCDPILQNFSGHTWLFVLKKSSAVSE